ncbi:MAG TPA: CRISPR-associated endonuclease Cas3'' [Dehalococcoidia bacterium]|nr:CRISPR-associated endonuclease Cas3'' [Dehalococcoidia bacterium]
MVAYAHSANPAGEWHLLEDHLRDTAQRAAGFAGAFGAAELARCLGLWHDLGKFHPDWQQYLLSCERDPKLRGHGPDHKRAGSRFAMERLGLPAMAIQGHHAGMKSPTTFEAWLNDPQTLAAVDQALRRARAELLELGEQTELAFPAFAQRRALAGELFLRMLFSCLVDADFLDTERHFNETKAEVRGADVAPGALFEQLQGDQGRRFAGAPGTALNRARQEIYDHCLEAAAQPPGLFRLAVPTGGGKTRSGMAFALRHAALHGLERVIVAVPFITITEQTSTVYREIFGDDAERPVVLEHHSGALRQTGEADAVPRAELWSRLSSENWDAPIVVTTTVQLFESLFAAGPRACRKVHRLAKSVIVLDEAQSLPPGLLTPILDALQELCANYGTTVVVSTATQPAFETIPVFRAMQAREIVPQPERHFSTLKRVKYDLRLDEALSWDDVAVLMRAEPRALAVVNTKRDALALLDALHDPEALHLSTLLCGAHRRAVIEEVKRRQAAGEPCRLVATQVVEAGVDLDFPLVLRALGPLDAIVQAAGRCNREGHLAEGRVIVFRPAEGGLPPGPYTTATEISQAVLATPDADPDDPRAPQAYFRELFRRLNTDREAIQKLRDGFDFDEVARRFRMIDESTFSVVIDKYGSPNARREVQRELARLRRGGAGLRQALRALQPFLVSVRERDAKRYEREGLIVPVIEGVGEWLGRYDETRGLEAAGVDLLVG